MDMLNWKKAFRSTMLEKGMQIYNNKRVFDLKENNKRYTASVLGTKRYEVSITVQDGKIKSARCQCPVSKGMGWCEHMAAVLYAVENREHDIEEQQLEEARKRAEQYLREETQKKDVLNVQNAQAQKKTQEVHSETEQKKIHELHKEKLQREAEEKKKEMEERRKKQEEEKAKLLAAKIKQQELERQRKEKLRQQKEEEERIRREEQKRKSSEEYEVLGDVWEENDLENSEALEENLRNLENYTYFDGEKILRSLKAPLQIMQTGEALFQRNKLTIEQIRSGFDAASQGASSGYAAAKGIERNSEFYVQMVFSNKKITYTRCNCSECRKKSWGWYAENSKCQYVAALAFYVRDYLEKGNFADATDMNGNTLLNAYQKERVKSVSTENMEKASENVVLMPRLQKKEDKLFVSFKVGTGKMFVVKKLDEFCQQVRDGAMAKYGSNTQISHRMQDFTKDSRKWIRFIDQIVREEERFVDKIQNSGMYFSKKFNVGSSLELFGWRLDSFYENLGVGKIDFEDKSAFPSKDLPEKAQLQCAKGNPRVSIHIEDVSRGSRTFDGIAVKGNLPDLFQGMECAYFIQNNEFCKTEDAFMEKIKPLAELSVNGSFHFQLGRNTMSSFYYNVLPGLQDVADITEENPEKFRQYLTPKVHFVFYLDMEEDNVICRIRACYGKREFSVGKLLVKEEIPSEEQFRDLYLEEKILDRAMEWLPFYDPDYDVLHCQGEEDLVFHMMESGTAALMELGEVRCTNRFRNKHILKVNPQT